jgi:hypothetical protein
VMDCRICGDPNSAMRFAFIEFLEEAGAQEVRCCCQQRCLCSYAVLGLGMLGQQLVQCTAQYGGCRQVAYLQDGTVLACRTVLGLQSTLWKGSMCIARLATYACRAACKDMCAARGRPPSSTCMPWLINSKLSALC